MKAALRFLCFPSIVISIVVFWIWLDSVLGWRGVRIVPVGIALVLAGCFLNTWCVLVFFRIGKGTPHPFTAKTTRLVTSGPYGVVRNPIMHGVGAILVGITLWIGSAALWFGIACFLAWILLFIPLYEEPDMERRFGDEYREYCRRVPRWFPRFGSSRTRPTSS